MLDPWDAEVPAVLLSWYPRHAGWPRDHRPAPRRRRTRRSAAHRRPRRREDLPVVDWNARSVTYGRLWGQRKLDRDGTPAAYPFGFGLGYTTFELQDLSPGPIDGERFLATVTPTRGPSTVGTGSSGRRAWAAERRTRPSGGQCRVPVRPRSPTRPVGGGRWPRSRCWPAAAPPWSACSCPASRNFVPAPARVDHLLAMTRRATSDRWLLALYAIGACPMGAYVAVYNAVGFRLTSAPLHLSLATAGLMFLVSPVGTLSSTLAGRLAGRMGQGNVMPVGCAIILAGVLLTMSGTLPVLLLGLAVMTAGFFVVHGVASGWVPTRATASGVAAGQAASLYLFAYSAGSSLFGGLAGRVWSAGG